MTIALACYVILPTGLALRPYYVPGNDFFARTVRTLYRTDTPHQCVPVHPCVQLGNAAAGVLPLPHF